MRARKFFRILFLLLLLGCITICFCNQQIVKSAEGRLYSNPAALPFRKTGLLLGTAKFLADGRENPYYTFRIEAALSIIKAGKIQYLVISGDNGRQGYNEPEDMRVDLLKHGVDSNCIYLDYAGFRTFDSMVRLRNIFGQQEVVIISQLFHNERAVYIAQREGIAAIGYNARDVPKSAGFRVKAREKLARGKVFLDYLTGVKPKFGGKRIELL